MFVFFSKKQLSSDMMENPSKSQVNDYLVIKGHKILSGIAAKLRSGRLRIGQDGLSDKYPVKGQSRKKRR
jgi:hypothetical protein